MKDGVYMFTRLISSFGIVFIKKNNKILYFTNLIERERLVRFLVINRFSEYASDI